MKALQDLPTPALVVDREILERNLTAMADRARRLGVALRPHIKTHKTLEIARRQRELGASGLTVSTLEEARVFAEHGFDDLTWAFPVIPGRLDEARQIAERAGLHLVVDSDVSIEALERLGHPFPVLLEIDSGDHRSGADPRSDETLALVRHLAGSRVLRFAGLLTHAGQSYHERGREALAAVAEAERRVMTELAATLRDEGIEVETVSVGSTPGMCAATDLTGVTEARPGNYCYYDYMQTRIGSCEVGDCALTVLATVISSGAGHAVVDAGALALSKDTGLEPAGDEPRTAGRLLREDGTLDPDRWLTVLSQEHGKVNRPLPVGAKVRILPHHSCLTNACFDRVWVAEGERVVDRWKVWRGR